MGKLKNIEWKNIFYMICYCIEELDSFNTGDISYEDIEGTHDLLATLLVKSFEQVVKNGYLSNFVENEIVTDRPYGRIDLVKSYTTGSYACGRLHCDVDEIDINIKLNQIVKAAFNILIDINTRLDKKISDNLVMELNHYRTFLNGVDNTSITKQDLEEIDIKQIPKWYVASVAIAKLIINEYIVIDEKENIRLLELRDPNRLCRIWEKFVRRLIRKEHPNLDVTKQRIYFDNGEYIEPDIIVVDHHNKMGIILDCKWYEGETMVASNMGELSLNCMALHDELVDYKIRGINVYASSNKQTVIKSPRKYKNGDILFTSCFININDSKDILIDRINWLLSSMFKLQSGQDIKSPI